MSNRLPDMTVVRTQVHKLAQQALIDMGHPSLPVLLETKSGRTLTLMIRRCWISGTLNDRREGVKLRAGEAVLSGTLNGVCICVVTLPLRPTVADMTYAATVIAEQLVSMRGKQDDKS